MALSIIDGTIESADLKRTAAKVRIYRSIVFRLPDGETKTIAKPIAHTELGPYLEPGMSGRFYLFTSFDHRGVYGVRTSSGQAHYHFPKNNEVIGMWVTLFAIVAGALMIALIGDISLWFLIAIILGPVVWLYNRANRKNAERIFAGDQAAAPAPVTA